jgi:hypothetical protein
MGLSASALDKETDAMSRLQAFLEKAIKEKNRQDSAHLGDRSEYVGASDIAGCPRKAVLSKKNPQEHDAKTLLRFARGHVTEGLLAGIFAAGGLKFDRETEIPHPDYPFIRSHIDFLFSSSKRLHVVELKTVDGIPDEPYSSWVDQLHTQMGLLELDRPGLPIGGSILAVDLNAGEWHEFNSYRPNELIFNVMIEKGRHIWSAVNGHVEPKTEPGILCGYCPQRKDCPAFIGGVVELPAEIESMVDGYHSAIVLKARTERTLRALKGHILSFAGNRFKGTTLDEHLLLNVWEVGPSETVDAKSLKAKFPDVYSQVKRPKAGYTRMEVRTLN